MKVTLQEMPLWPFGLYVLLVLMLVSAILLVSNYLGQKRQGEDTAKPYESGIPPTQLVRTHSGAGIAAKYYMVALFFIVFDIEAAFLFAWSSAARELGWQGYFGALAFLFVLAVALVYEWRLGILDFGPRNRTS